MLPLTLLATSLTLISVAAAADTFTDCTQSSDPYFKIQACIRLIEENPNDEFKRANGHLNLGNAYQAKRDFNSAIHEFDQVVRLNPSYALVYCKRCFQATAFSACAGR